MNQVLNHLLPWLLFSMLLLVSQSQGFVPVSVVVLRPLDYGTSTRIHTTAKLEGIAQELQELGQEIQPHVFHVKHGFNEFKESLVHKLRRAVYERDKLFHEALKELEQYTLHNDIPASSSSMDTLLLATLQDIQQMLQEEPRVIELAWKSAEWELENNGRDAADSSVGSTFLELVHTLQTIEQELVASREQAIKKDEASKGSQVGKSKREEDESVTRLLWRVLKLTGRRIKNAVGFVLCFGRTRKARQE